MVLFSTRLPFFLPYEPYPLFLFMYYLNSFTFSPLLHYHLSVVCVCVCVGGGGRVVCRTGIAGGRGPEGAVSCTERLFSGFTSSKWRGFFKQMGWVEWRHRPVTGQTHTHSLTTQPCDSSVEKMTDLLKCVPGFFFAVVSNDGKMIHFCVTPRTACVFKYEVVFRAMDKGLSTQHLHVTRKVSVLFSVSK